MVGTTCCATHMPDTSPAPPPLSPWPSTGGWAPPCGWGHPSSRCSHCWAHWQWARGCGTPAPAGRWRGGAAAAGAPLLPGAAEPGTVGWRVCCPAAPNMTQGHMGGKHVGELLCLKEVCVCMCSQAMPTMESTLCSARPWPALSQQQTPCLVWPLSD